jgi:hypothetical protein
MVRYAAAPDEPEADAGPDGPKMWSKNLVVFYETDPGSTSHRSTCRTGPR